MAQENWQKYKLLKLLELLRQDTDEQHPLATSALCNRLAEMGISCERRTLTKDIAVLNGLGYEVMWKWVGKEKGYYIEDRSFSVPELKILIDAVQAASFITDKKAAELIDKIAELGGTHTEEQYIEIKEARKKNRDKQTDKRLEVLQLRCEGKGLEEIASKTNFHRSHVSNLIRKYFAERLASVAEKHYRGNRRNMSIDQEAAFLEQYRDQAEQRHVLNVHEIAKAYEKEVGHSIGNSQIYRVLHRHGWRKVMSRSKHPKKASEEVIETLKKLTPKSRN